MIKLTDAEHRMMKTRSAESGIEMQVLARRLLVQHLKL